MRKALSGKHTSSCWHPHAVSPACARARHKSCSIHRQRANVQTRAVATDLSRSSPAFIAHRANTLGFGFSAGGLLFPFYVGLVQGLRQSGALTDSTPVAGASAGSLIAACSKLGLTHEQLTVATLELAAECRRRGTRGNLGPVLEQQLRRLLPDDAHERATTGKVHVAVTQVQPKLEPVLVNRFSSRDDLIEALLTSCHIPWWFDGSLITDFRGTKHCDGGLTNFLPSPTGTTHTVRVCCFPSKQMRAGLGPLCITPDTFDPDWPHDLRTMLGWAFNPADDDTLLMLLDKGERAGVQWAATHGIAPPALATAAAGEQP